MPASPQFVWLDLQNAKTCPYKACLNCPTQSTTSYQLTNHDSSIFSPIIHLCIYWLLPTVIICWRRDPNARLLPVCECARCYSTLATCPKQLTRPARVAHLIQSRRMLFYSKHSHAEDFQTKSAFSELGGFDRWWTPWSSRRPRSQGRADGLASGQPGAVSGWIWMPD